MSNSCQNAVNADISIFKTGSNPVTSTSVETLENALKTAFSRVFLMLFRGFILAHFGSFCDKKVVKKLSDF